MAKDKRETETETEPEMEKIRLTLSLDEAQLVFDLLGAAVLPKRTRKLALKTYRRFERESFIHDDFQQRRR